MVEVSRDSMYMRPKDNWAQWVLPEEQRDKNVHVVVQQAVAASSDAQQQQQQVHSPRHKKGGHKEGKEGPTSPKAAAAPAVQEQQQDQEQQQQQQPKEAPAAAAAEAKEPAAAAAEPAAPAAEQPPAAAAEASAPPPAPSTGVRKIDEDEEMNEDDMFELDEVRADWLPACLPACLRGLQCASAASSWVVSTALLPLSRLTAARSNRSRGTHSTHLPFLLPCHCRSTR